MRMLAGMSEENNVPGIRSIRKPPHNFRKDVGASQRRRIEIDHPPNQYSCTMAPPLGRACGALGRPRPADITS